MQPSPRCSFRTCPSPRKLPGAHLLSPPVPTLSPRQPPTGRLWMLLPSYLSSDRSGSAASLVRESPVRTDRSLCTGGVEGRLSSAGLVQSPFPQCLVFLAPRPPLVSHWAPANAQACGPHSSWVCSRLFCELPSIQQCGNSEGRACNCDVGPARSIISSRQDRLGPMGSDPFANEKKSGMPRAK